MSRIKKGYNIHERVKCVNPPDSEVSFGKEYEVLDFIRIDRGYEIFIKCDDGWGRFYKLENFTPVSVIRLAKLKEIMKNI